jgi:hypothetical protein
MSNIRFRILSPANTGAPNYTMQGEAQFPVAEANMGLTLNIDGEDIIASADVSAEIFPQSGTTTANGLVWSLSRENVNWFKLAITFKTTSAHETTTLGVTISKTGYTTYVGSMAIYNYDLGNNSNQVYDIGSPITLNPELDFILIDTVSGNAVSNGIQYPPFASFVYYRKPFTNLIHIVKNNSSIGAHTFSLYEGGFATDLLFTGESGIIESADDITIVAAHSAFLADSESDEVTIAAKTWYPGFTTAISAPENNTENTETINVFGSPDFLTEIDVDSMSDFYQGDVKTYPYNHMQLVYKIYDKDGTQVDTLTINGSIKPYPYVFSVTDWDFEDFLTPTLGDYVVNLVFKVLGILQTATLDSDDTLTEGQLYKIITNGGGADFTSAGAGANTIGTEFFYNGGTITWGTATVSPISPIIESTLNVPVTGDTTTSLTQTDCSVYQVLSNTFDILWYRIQKLDSDGTFVDLETDGSGTIAALDSITLDFGADNIYKLIIYNHNFEEPEGTPDETSYTYIIANYCSLRSCVLTMLNKVICKDPTCKCKQSLHYEFNALIINATAYFNMLNTEYGYNYIYESLSVNKLAELRELKEFLDRFTDYCAECTEACDDAADCGC